MAVARNRQTSGAYIQGVDALLAALKEMGPEWAKELKDAHKEVGERGAEWARWTAAGSGTRQQQAAMAAIKGSGRETEARIFISSAKRTAFAAAAFWGAKKRSGWFAASKYASSAAKQFSPWVGDSWSVAVAGEGPYAINPALAEHMDDILEFFELVIDRVTAKAFPD